MNATGAIAATPPEIPGPHSRWRDEQRALAARARMGYVHPAADIRKPGTLLKFRGGSAVVVGPDGAYRRALPENRATT